MKLRLLTIASVLAGCPTQASETMRCGKWVVDNEATLTELIAKCGEPTSKEVTETDVHGRSPAGRGTIVMGKTVTERWIYDRGSRAFHMIVTIVDGKLKSIDKAE